MTKKRTETPNRYREARSDAAVKSIEDRIAKDYGLPKGSIQITNPGGRNTRSDASIKSVRKNWDKK